MPDKNLNNDCMHVSIGVVAGLDKRILLATRVKNGVFTGLWEFPGGKVEYAEKIEDALKRELEEEVGICPINFESLISICHDVKQQKIMLHVFYVSSYVGEPEGKEGQTLIWVHPKELFNYPLPSVNYAILNAIILPKQYAVINCQSNNNIEAGVLSILEEGIRLLQFRAGLQENEYIYYAQKLAVLCGRFDAIMMLRGKYQWLKEEWCSGIHLSSSEALKLYQEGWIFRREKRQKLKKWLAVSCHNLQDIKIAELIGAHFVSLSPICMTSFHPDMVPLGCSLATEITFSATIPVYWFGGMHWKNISLVKASHAQGVAVIEDF